MRLVWTGLGVGVGCALALTRTMQGLLFGVHASDPGTFVVVPLVFGLVAILACALPALRATRIDPTIALRHH